jgi:signal peptidase I
MRTGASLALIGFGAILAFAVTGRTSFFNVQVAGYVFMVIGLIGLYLRRRGWVGRQLLIRRTRAVPGDTIVIQDGPGDVADQPDGGSARPGLSRPPEAATPPQDIQPVPAAPRESEIVEEEYYEG